MDMITGNWQSAQLGQHRRSRPGVQEAFYPLAHVHTYTHTHTRDRETEKWTIKDEFID